MARSTITSIIASGRQMSRQWGWLMAITALALLLRAPFLGGSLWLDEAAQALESARPLSQQLDIIPDFQPPLMHVLLHFVMQINTSEAWMRWWLAVIPGLGSILFCMLLTEKTLGRRSALAVGILLATSSFHVFYSQELRPYALPMIWATAGWWWVVTRLQPNPKQGANWTVWVMLSVLGWYSSYLYPFVWIVQVLWLALRLRSQLKKLSMSIIGVGLAFLPWLPTFLKQLSAGGEVRTNLPGWSEVVSFTQLKSLPLVAGKFLFGVVDLGMVWWQVILGVVLLVLLGLATARLWFNWRQRSRVKWLLHFKPWGWLFLWAVLPLLLAWFVSFWIPVVQPKRVIWLLPAWYMMLLWLVRQIRHRALGYLLVGVVLAINCVGLASYWLQPTLQRENWRSAHLWLSERYPADRTLVIVAFDEVFAPWRWYDQGQYQTLAFGPGKFNVKQVGQLRQHLAPVAYYEFVVTFDYLTDLSDPEDELLTELSSYGFQEVDMIAYPNIGFIRVWARPASLISTAL